MNRELRAINRFYISATIFFIVSVVKGLRRRNFRQKRHDEGVHDEQRHSA